MQFCVYHPELHDNNHYVNWYKKHQNVDLQHFWQTKHAYLEQVEFPFNFQQVSLPVLIFILFPLWLLTCGIAMVSSN